MHERSSLDSFHSLWSHSNPIVKSSAASNHCQARVTSEQDALLKGRGGGARAPPPPPPPRRWLPHHVEELEGLAEGACVPFVRLLVLNCGEEFTTAGSGAYVSGMSPRLISATAVSRPVKALAFLPLLISRS
jgi:hypothetical protein